VARMSGWILENLGAGAYVLIAGNSPLWMLYQSLCESRPVDMSICKAGSQAEEAEEAHPSCSYLPARGGGATAWSWFVACSSAPLLHLQGVAGCTDRL
jgi:hypothetical protein